MIYECPACGRENEDEDAATLWMTSPFGLTTLRTCRTQECAKRAVALRETVGWKLRPGNLPPMSKDEREKIERGRT